MIFSIFLSFQKAQEKNCAFSKKFLEITQLDFNTPPSITSTSSLLSATDIKCEPGREVGTVDVARKVVVAVRSWIIRAGNVVHTTTINTKEGVVDLLSPFFREITPFHLTSSF